MDFGGTPRAGAVLDRVSAPRADESETGRWFEGIRDRLQQSDAAVGAVITPTRKSTFFTPLAAYQPVVKVPRSGDQHDRFRVLHCRAWRWGHAAVERGK